MKHLLAFLLAIALTGCGGRPAPPPLDDPCAITPDEDIIDGGVGGTGKTDRKECL